MKKLSLALLAGLSVGLAACATTGDAASQIGTGATSTATSETSGAVNQKVGDETRGFWNRLFGNH